MHETQADFGCASRCYFRKNVDDVRAFEPPRFRFRWLEADKIDQVCGRTTAVQHLDKIRERVSSRVAGRRCQLLAPLAQLLVEFCGVLSQHQRLQMSEVEDPLLKMLCAQL